MSKDYREKIEEHRQSIEEEKQLESRLARSRRTVKKNKKRTSPLMTGLVVVFIFIPLMILIYVWGFYEPQETEVVKVDDNNTIVQVEKNNTVSASDNKDENVVVEENVEKTADESEKEQKTTNQSEELKQQQAEEAARKAEQQAKAEEVARQQEAQQKALEEQRKQQEKAQEEQSVGQTVHTVQSDENLFRIALKYFNGDPNGVQKIKDANNLPSDSISVGQQLIIPQ